ncbi:MAG TPA: hypothetical protein VMY36_02325 [Patescibacteria group bacterium]|nr:hypothetical protein [Patescibacteria group bacterium]
MKIKKKWILGYLAIDIICIGMGMGVPFFNILLGFPLGYFLARNFIDERKVFRYSIFASLFTFLILAVIWLLAMLPYCLDSTKDIANFGEPLILFTPVASFWGWLVLMVVISPFLQLLTTIFSAYLTHLRKKIY